MNENILEINDLAVSFSVGGERLHALRGVSLSLCRGETLALVGESGSGKSVTSRAVLGILPKNARVDGGSVKFCGKEIIGASEKELCALRGRQMAMIFQDPTSALDPIVKVGRQISEVVRLDKSVGAAEARRRAVALMGEVGIPDPDERYNRYPFEFSGGMRQRIVIAIADTAGVTVTLFVGYDFTAVNCDITVNVDTVAVIRTAGRNLTAVYSYVCFCVVTEDTNRLVVGSINSNCTAVD